MTEPMSDERLAQLSLAADSPPPFDDFATRIVHDALRDLVAEAKRARGEESRLRALVGDEIGTIGQGFDRDEQMRDLLGSIWLYVGWRSATRSLTTEQREMWADAVDARARARQIEDGEELHPVADRWWRDDA
jgi:hypothetical protein